MILQLIPLLVTLKMMLQDILTLFLMNIQKYKRLPKLRVTKVSKHIFVEHNQTIQ